MPLRQARPKSTSLLLSFRPWPPHIGQSRRILLVHFCWLFGTLSRASAFLCHVLGQDIIHPLYHTHSPACLSLQRAPAGVPLSLCIGEGRPTNGGPCPNTAAKRSSTFFCFCALLRGGTRARHVVVSPVLSHHHPVFPAPQTQAAATLRPESGGGVGEDDNEGGHGLSIFGTRPRLCRPNGRWQRSPRGSAGER